MSAPAEVFDFLNMIHKFISAYGCLEAYVGRKVALTPHSSYTFSKQSIPSLSSICLTGFQCPYGVLYTADQEGQQSTLSSTRVVKLQNGIKATLVSDIKSKNNNQNDINENANNAKKNIKFAAAALCVRTGGFNDPDDIPGLSHFLEHMVFMGSAKYPDENGFDAFITKHSGSSNAGTEDEQTTYQFEIQPEHLEEALDRLSQFFISPLFRENAVKREIKAVDSEFKEGLPVDHARAYAIYNHLARKDHPFSKFTVGNKLSLMTNPKKQGVDVLKNLRDYFGRYYLTEPITLSICSTETLDVLESWTKKYFSGLMTRNEIVPLCDLELKLNNPFEMETFHKLVHVASVKEMHELQLCWVIPPTASYYRSKPCYYISWLLGHECEGSVYSLLKKKGYILSLNTYDKSWSMMSLFFCSVEMTEKGLENIHEIVHTIFQYISLMQRKGPSENMYKEMTKSDKAMFRYLEPNQPVDYVVDLAENMMKYKEKDYICGSYRIPEYNPTLIEEYQKYLTTDSVNVMILSKTFSHSCFEKETWYKTKYVGKGTQENDDLFLPKENRFVAHDFQLKTLSECSQQKYPKMIQENRLGKVWHKLDQKFLLPKANCYFKFISALNVKSPYHSACLQLLQKVLDFNLAELTYEGERAFLSIETLMTCKGFEILFTGFHDKLMLFFQKYIDQFLKMDIKDVAFSVSKEELCRTYKNDYLSTDVLVDVLRLSVLQSYYSNSLYNLKELKKLTLQNFKNFLKVYLSQLYVESLFQGNITDEEAANYQNYLHSAMRTKELHKVEFPKLLKICLPKGRTVCRHYGFNKNDPNTAIQNYYQIGHAINLKLHMTAKLLHHIMAEPLFDILRTKEQLGYTIGHDVHYSEGVLGFSITVETEVGKCSADKVDAKIEDFLKQFSDMLKVYTAEQYSSYVKSFIQMLKEEDITLEVETWRNWDEIFQQHYIFDRLERAIAVTETILKSEVESLLQMYILDKDNVCVLCTQVIGHGDEDGEPDSENAESDLSSGDDSSDSDYSSEEDDGDTDEGFQLIKVQNKQYTRCITDIEQFHREHSFFPHSVMNLL